LRAGPVCGGGGEKKNGGHRGGKDPHSWMPVLQWEAAIPYTRYEIALYIYIYIDTVALFYTLGVECHSTPNLI
jgi:hypothetical protein